MSRPYKIIAVDFDGTLVENKYPRIGKPNLELITYLIKRRQDGDKVILWTCRVGTYLRRAINVCRKYGLYFDAVNANLPEVIESFGRDTRKIVTDEYVDDHNIFCTTVPYYADTHGSKDVTTRIKDALIDGLDF